MIFRISVAAELALFALANGAQTASPSQDCRPIGRPWDSRNAQAPLAKTYIRSKTVRFIIKLIMNKIKALIILIFIVWFLFFGKGYLKKPFKPIGIKPVVIEDILGELTKGSELITVCKFIDQTSVPQKALDLYFWDLEVESVIKGPVSKGEHICVSTGPFQDYTAFYFEAGERGLVFMSRDKYHQEEEFGCPYYSRGSLKITKKDKLDIVNIRKNLTDHTVRDYISLDECIDLIKKYIAKEGTNEQK